MTALTQPLALPEVGYVPGAWDMFHVGHLNILLKARELCQRLVVGVVTDEVLAQAKNKTVVVPLAERMRVVSAIDVVDDVVVDESSDKLLAWRRVGFDVIIKGDDWQGSPKGDQLERDMASVGVQVQYFPYTQDVSSTLLRGALGDRQPRRRAKARVAGTGRRRLFWPASPLAART
ncbi:adenylyltransferase/cytidyltransferase family protein, partial [Desertihabitans aurantiacus]|uniref:adenylyltransferase/cytidyltransferase family protein n=1 Tax=Desertihabitans aurantiacus TaxID=2282477 RepID=UPI000DF73237